MAELNDIQLRIIVQGTGLDNLQRLNDAVAKATGNIKLSGDAASGAKSKWAEFGDALSALERKFDAVFRAASHLQALGRDLTGMGEAGIGMLKGAVDAWGDYEFAVHRAAGALGIFDTTSPIFKQLQEEINNTAQEARLFPAEEIAKAVYYWGSATGQTVENTEDLKIVMKGLLPIMQTAAITETDYEKAIKGTYQIIQQYGVGLTRMADAQDVAAGRATRVGEEMSNVADITEKLMMITQNTALEYDDLIESFRYTGSIAPALGVTWEELAVVLGRLGDLGIRGSGAGRALQQTFTKLVDPTVRASKALDSAWQKAYGLDQTFDKMVFPNGKFIGLTEYIDMLADVTEDMTQKERNNLIAIMTTQNELRTMVPLIEDQIKARKSGISVYDQEKYSLENASEQFERTMHLLEISWKGTMGYLSNTIGPVVRLIGAEVARIAAPFVEAFGVILQQIKAFLDANPELVQWFVKIVAAASALALVAGAIFTALGVLMAFGAGLAFVIKGMAEFTGIFTRFVPILGAVIVVVTALATNFGGLRDAVMHVIDAVVKVWNAMDQGSASSGVGVLERLGKAVLPILEKVAEGAAFVLNKIAEGLEWIARTPEAIKVVEGVASALSLFLAAGFVAKIAGLAFNIATLGTNALGAAPYVKMLGGSMSKFFSISSLWPPNLIRNFKELNAAMSMTATDSKNKLLSAKDAIISGIKGIGPAVAGAASALAGHFGAMVASVKLAATGISLSIKSVLIATGIGAIIVALGLLAEAWMNNWGDIQGKFAAVVEWFGGLPATIGTFFSQVWTNISTWVGQIVATVVAFPGTIWDGLVEGFNSIMEWLGAWWTSLGENTGERIGFIVGFVIAMPVRLLIELVKGFAGIWNWFVGWWENLTASIGRWVTGVVTTILSWVSKLPGGIANFFSQVWTNISTWFSKAIPAVGTWASQTITSIINWIATLPGKIGAWLGTTFTTLSTWFTTQLIPNAGTWTLNAVKQIIKFLAELPGKAVTAIVPMIGDLADFFRALPGKIMNTIVRIGGQIVNGIWRGIQNAWQTFWNNVWGFFEGIVNGVRAGLGIDSPSKVFAEIGHQMMAGLDEGVSKNRDALYSMNDQIDAMVDATDKVKTTSFDMMDSDFGFDSTEEKRLVIEHVVSSPDGTVNAASRETIKEIFTAEEFVSALEHMATVG